MLKKETKINAVALLGKQIDVLDKGFIRLVDYMGSDAAIVQAARVSYGEGTKTIMEDDGLIRYLMRHRHTTPFEMCELKFHVKVPMDCWRQWIRHRTASVNEYSTRYSVAINDKKVTEPDEWRLQSIKNKQGSKGVIDKQFRKILTSQEKDLHLHADDVYEYRLENNIAREQARKDLPLSTYTEAYWKIDLHNLLHFLSLRMDEHAQLEIRSYANVIGYDFIAHLFPLTWEAFLDYDFRMAAVLLSARDIDMMQRMRDDVYIFEREDSFFGWFDKRKDGELKSNMERQEFEKKMERLDISVPWT